jgi:hypothetical protein
MKNLRKLGAAVVLTSVLALSAFAGEIPTPPCAPPEPGQTDTPPCAAAPGNMGTSTVASNETSFTEIAASVLLNVLPLF